MNAHRTRALKGIVTITAFCAGLAITQAVAAATETQVPRNLLLWDTSSRMGDKLDSDRSRWKEVPNDLLQLETDPPKASSDPGYYGREYRFKGDAVVETPALTAVFWSARGCVALYSKEATSRTDQSPKPAGWPGRKIVEVSPVQTAGTASRISRVEIVRNADDEILLEAFFSPVGSPEIAAVVSFDRCGIVEFKPEGSLKHLRLSTSLEYGIVPGFIGDDLIFGASGQFGTNTLALPSENLFLGLLPGEDEELVVTWPEGKQRVSLGLGEEHGEQLIRSVDFDGEGQSLYLAVLGAPGIWHKETLKPEDLEKDVRIHWKRPFPARWKTQLFEEDLKTTFVFRQSRGQVWRGVAGSYIYPVWFNGEEAYYHLSKKIPPKGESLIYCLEPRDTPTAVSTPADILKETLGRTAAGSILDLAGRKLRTHHRRGAEGVRRACTCGCTEAIQAIFQAGEEASQKSRVQQELDDMIFFVHCHVNRINEYRQFTDGLLKTLQAKRRSSPELKLFLDSLEEIAQKIPQECEVQKENMKNFKYADELSARTMALTASNDPGNLKAYMDLLKAWRDMGGAQDYVLAKCHVITRDLYRAAGYGCAAQPQAVPLAEAIRTRCRQVLRNPDGYEIWADY